MTPERWQRVEQLFEQAQALPSAARESWLAAQCGGDAVLAAEVHSLLCSAQDAHPLLGAHTSPGAAMRQQLEALFASSDTVAAEHQLPGVGVVGTPDLYTGYLARRA